MPRCLTLSIISRVKLKEIDKKGTYIDLARVLKKLGNMKLSFIRIVIRALDWLVGWLDFYGISTFAGYFTPNQFLDK